MQHPWQRWWHCWDKVYPSVERFLITLIKKFLQSILVVNGGGSGGGGKSLSLSRFL